jgi:hypothetical protein
MSNELEYKALKENFKKILSQAFEMDKSIGDNLKNIKNISQEEPKKKSFIDKLKSQQSIKTSQNSK